MMNNNEELEVEAPQSLVFDIDEENPPINNATNNKMQSGMESLMQKLLSYTLPYSLYLY